MKTAPDSYLRNIRSRLRLDPATEKNFLRELVAHLQDKTAELKKSGYSQEEAADKAVLSMGPEDGIADQIYRAHSRGTWVQAAVAASPHVLFAVFFALHLWRNPLWWLALMGAILLIVVAYGWRHGRPAWLFPWLGYSAVPLIVAAILLLSLPQRWGYLAILVYLPFALWLVLSVTIQTVRRDWLFVSLMLLPLPPIAGWLLTLHRYGWFRHFNAQLLLDLAPWIALSFLALAATAATFIRMSQRKLKTSALLTPELLTLVMIALAGKGGLSFPWLLVLLLLCAGILAGPALLERKIGHGTREDNSWGVSLPEQPERRHL